MKKNSGWRYISLKDFEKLSQDKGLTGGIVESPLGLLMYRVIEGAVCGIGFKDAYPFRNHLDKIFKKDYKVDNTKGEQVLSCLLKKHPFPLMLVGTRFQHTVWQELLKIPPGQCVSYQSVAAKLGDIKKVRAVASAVGRNPLSWVVPCHRVTPKQGGTGRYLWGESLKAKLLEFEGYHINAA